MRRWRHCFLFVTGQTDLSYEEWSFIMALDQTNADIATLNGLANQVVSALHDAQGAAASAQQVAQQAQSELSSADSTVSASLQQIISILQAAVPAAPAAPSA